VTCCCFVVLGDVVFSFNKGKIFVIPFYYNFELRILKTLYFRNLDNLSLSQSIVCWVLLDCQIFHKFSGSPEDESSVLSERLCGIFYLQY
jgi:hypothetical protein